MADEGEPSDKSKPKEPTQAFVALCRIISGSDSAEPGEPIQLTRGEHKELSRLGVIEGVWKRN